MHTLKNEAKKLTLFIKSLPDFVVKSGADTHSQMGAVVVDGILQASLNYENVVKPRVNKVKKHPEAETTSGFLELCNEKGIKNIIDWKDDKKPDYIIALLKFLKNKDLETVAQLKVWLDDDKNIEIFVKENKGIGNVTAQYFRILCGSQSVKIDRHVKNFLKEAGINVSDEKELRDIVIESANIQKVKPTHLDYSVWAYQSKKHQAK